MLSINDINEMRETIDRQNRIIAVLKRIVKQWVKEYNILDEIIDMYKMSENEANEIIAELKHTLDCKNGTIETLKAENIKFTLDSKKLVAQYSAELERLKQTLQEIKAIVCGNYEIIDPQGRKDILKLITKAEEE